MNKKLKAIIIKQTQEVIKQCKTDSARLLGHVKKIEIDIETAEAIIRGMKDE